MSGERVPGTPSPGPSEIELSCTTDRNQVTLGNQFGLTAGEVPAAGPFASAAPVYAAAGWSVIYVNDGKTGIPSGYTGSKGRSATAAELSRWAAEFPGANIAIRLPRDMVAIDVDHYDDKRGADTLAELRREFGPLPPTYVATARALPSGKYLFRVPNGTRLKSKPGPGVETIQFHHRYVVVAPSVHHTGATVRWIDERSGEVLDGVPDPDDVPELPWTWIDALSVTGSDASGEVAADAEVARWLEHDSNQRPAWLEAVLARVRKEVAGNRHDTILTALCQVAREAAAGAYPASAAVRELRTLFDANDHGNADDFDADLAWAVGQLHTEDGRRRIAEIKDRLRTATPPDLDSGDINLDGDEGGEPDELAAGLPVLPDEFWEARPVLAQIRQAARSLLGPPDAVLGVVLARVAALMPHTVKLPEIIGGAVGLTYYVAPIGPPASGKSVSIGIARRIIPITTEDIPEVTTGSGEGLVEVLFGMVDETDDHGKTKQVKQQVRHGVFVAIGEGSQLIEVGRRQGNTTMSVIREAYTDGILGNTNAAVERRRIVPAGEYVYGIAVAFQPELAGPLLDEAEAGTPQRFVWLAADDPTAPEQTPSWPEELHWTPPQVDQPPEPNSSEGLLGTMEFDYIAPGQSRQHHMTVPEQVANELRATRRAVMRRERKVASLDAHAGLVKLKTAALLAILDGRLTVDMEDWRLAGTLYATSAAVRSYVEAALRQVSAEREKVHTRKVIGREKASEDAARTRALASAARSVARMVVKQRTANHRDIHAAIASKHRRLVTTDEVIERAEDDGLIEPDGIDGKKWRPGPRTA